METTAALTTNHFKLSGTLKPLDPEIAKLQEDYLIMTKNREQAKADLQARFDEVYEKINQAKQLFIQSSVEINKKIGVFQKKHMQNIQIMEQEQTTQHNTFSQITDKKLNILDKDIVSLDKAIEQEKEDRIRTEKENIEQIQKQIDILLNNFEQEKLTRIENEKKNLQKIDETAKSVKNSIEQEAKEKQHKLEELKQNINHNLESQENYSKGFKDKTVNEFHLQVDSMENEMNNRFEHQDQVVDDLRSVITTIQNTLAILGKDV